MMLLKNSLFLLLLTNLLLQNGYAQEQSESARAIWPKEKANDWYAKQDWLVGANFIPSTAINQLEMWQEASFDKVTIDRELGLACAIGMNSMHVLFDSFAQTTLSDPCHEIQGNWQLTIINLLSKLKSKYNYTDLAH